jgi:hypothetical protein
MSRHVTAFRMVGVALGLLVLSLLPVLPAGAAPTRYEAESATVYQGVVESDHLNFSGTGFVNNDNVTGSYTEWTVNAPSAGSVTLTIRYANGTTTPRPADIAVNGTVVAAAVPFANTTNWDTWADKTITATLTAGAHTIRVTSTSSAGPPNLDYLDVEPANGPGNPYGDPNLVSMFNGTSLSGWTPSRADGWTAQSGAIHGTGTARGWIFYNTKQVGTFRWIFNLRQVVGDHAPTVLIWGTTQQPYLDALGGIQFQPPNGGHWDYRPGHNNGGGSLFTQYSHTKIDIHAWSQCELIGNQSTGIARMACCPLTPSASTCKGTEVLRFKDPTAGRVGPLALQVHNSGIQDEYRSLYVESPVVMNPDQFITTS